MKHSETRVKKAQETLLIIDTGSYTVNGKVIDIKQNIEHSVKASALYPADGFDDVLRSAEQKMRSLTFNTEIRVENTTVLKGAATMTATGNKIGCLNFASAKNPGGGFIKGAQAQEESLAVSSTLYDTQMKNYGLYNYNRHRSTYLYSDYMIYSDGVVVFRDDSGELLEEPYQLSVITSPAANVGAIMTNNPAEMPEVESTMLQRIDKMFALFVHHDIKHLLLGAWGCGVFRNDPKDIARWFAHYLKDDGKYASCFEKVLFAVYDRHKDQENINAFTEQFV